MSLKSTLLELIMTSGTQLEIRPHVECELTLIAEHLGTIFCDNRFTVLQVGEVGLYSLAGTCAVPSIPVRVIVVLRAHRRRVARIQLSPSAKYLGITLSFTN